MKPEVIRLKNTGEGGSHVPCYLHGTNSCCSKISGEHLISEAVLRILADRELEISGFSWLKGDKKLTRGMNCGGWFRELRTCLSTNVGLEIGRSARHHSAFRIWFARCSVENMCCIHNHTTKEP